MNPITPKVKKEVVKLTSFLTANFSEGSKTNLLAICEDEILTLCIDNYGSEFDGMLVWHDRQFFIHLNSAKGNTLESNRGRFTLAHELGHYFIDAHREGLKRGLLPPHPSNISLIHTGKMETEADYFASCLLMPLEKLRAFTGRRKFSFDIIRQISDNFGVSLTAAALRFTEVGTHEVMMVFSQGNKVKWYYRSPDFPQLANQFKVGGQLPPTSVAGESFLKSEAKYTGIELIDLEDWFYYRKGAPERQLYEQCFYSDIYDYVISLIWFE
ncbi:ImmA/IrrE family metallo-endopeptidase [Adhaeribacter swui]|uniref:ImmA/IrrE family metallo-endopeptidase n=1 Tax=Adhaeribacter swui TaxID=2086471 RepID=A0A7G7GB75_9BACT|nr:ImmA/IrrE family metallo-endopeptidase [Adhaeribacter swui]QNF34409.1 ImmA/IrrE family metallo-endopeptidase [Adhaeribacter swui]